MPVLETTQDTIPKVPWALRELPAFPPIATKLLQLLGQDDAEVKRVIELLRSDMAFGAEILRRANSARYGMRSQVSSLQHAVVLLGFEHIKSLAMAAAMGTYLKPALKVASLRRCWRHSVACALLAEELAKASYFEHDRAYTAGLLHDVGLLGLMVNFPNEYANLLFVTKENAFDLLAAERDLFEVDHCEAGGWLARQWKFPDEVIEAAEHHHDPPPEGEFHLTALIHWGCRLATVLGFEVAPPNHPSTFEEVLAGLPKSVQARFPSDQEALQATIETKVNALE